MAAASSSLHPPRLLLPSSIIGDDTPSSTTTNRCTTTHFVSVLLLRVTTKLNRRWQFCTARSSSRKPPWISAGRRRPIGSSHPSGDSLYQLISSNPPPKMSSLALVVTTSNIGDPTGMSIGAVPINDGSAATLCNEPWSETFEVTEHLWRTKSAGWRAFVHSVSDTKCGLAFRKAGVQEWAQEMFHEKKRLGTLEIKKLTEVYGEVNVVSFQLQKPKALSAATDLLKTREAMLAELELISKRTKGFRQAWNKGDNDVSGPNSNLPRASTHSDSLQTCLMALTKAHRLSGSFSTNAPSPQASPTIAHKIALWHSHRCCIEKSFAAASAIS
nr:ATP-dependent RNA helicase DEAH11, chloroplastic-like [Ipomoea batatas]